MLHDTTASEHCYQMGVGGVYANIHYLFKNPNKLAKGDLDTEKDLIVYLNNC